MVPNVGGLYNGPVFLLSGLYNGPVLLLSVFYNGPVLSLNGLYNGPVLSLSGLLCRKLLYKQKRHFLDDLNRIQEAKVLNRPL